MKVTCYQRDISFLKKKFLLKYAYLLCCVSFCCKAKGFSYTYIYIYMYVCIFSPFLVGKSPPLSQIRQLTFPHLGKLEVGRVLQAWHSLGVRDPGVFSLPFGSSYTLVRPHCTVFRCGYFLHFLSPSSYEPIQFKSFCL